MTSHHKRKRKPEITEKLQFPPEEVDEQEGLGPTRPPGLGFHCPLALACPWFKLSVRAHDEVKSSHKEQTREGPPSTPSLEGPYSDPFLSFLTSNHHNLHFLGSAFAHPIDPQESIPPLPPTGICLNYH
jgi:hypothetical protein